MSKYKRRASKRCNTCGAQCTAYMCGRCARELRELLIGSGRKTVQVGEMIKDQPGLIWYVGRLKEQAYQQSRLDMAMRAQRNTDDPEDDGIAGGYALLVDKRAVDLLVAIRASLQMWEDVVLRLCGPQTGDQSGDGVVGPVWRFNTTEARTARFLAANVKTIRLRCSSAHRLHTEMLSFAKQAYAVINRPPDNFCGPCPKCARQLYAQENEAKVRCDSCRSEHDVEVLRAAMREQVRDMLFTGPELRRLMETRLNDRIPEPTFRKLCRDGRLIPRGYNGADEDLFTYADVCEAREKPVPTRESRRK